MHQATNQKLAVRFDRDYQLAELLPGSLLDRVCENWESSGLGRIVVLSPDGSTHWASRGKDAFESGALQAGLAEDMWKAPVKKRVGDYDVYFFPLYHEMEVVGILAAAFPGAVSLPNQAEAANFIKQVLSEIVTLKYRASVTADIHGSVVEDSYVELQEKIAQLEKSEEKYRALAANLETLVEKKSEEIKLTQAHLMQQEKMASIGHLAAGVAHEINNPMSFISSNLNILGEYAMSMAEVVSRYRSLASGLASCQAREEELAALRRKVEEIVSFEQEMDLEYILKDLEGLMEESQEGADRILKIILDLKDFAHPGEQDFIYADINRGLESTLNIVGNELKYNTEVIRDYGELSKIICRPSQLNQVFMNILVNAAQSIEGHGVITVKTRQEEDGTLIQISDTGSGISKENLSNIFDPFFTTKEVGKGTGLGLNMAFNIVRRHQGTIEVQSELGKGTTFTIRLPVLDVKSQQAGRSDCLMPA